MKRILSTLFYILIIVLCLYQFRNVLGLKTLPSFDSLKTQILTKYFPCKEQIPYKLGNIDTEFGLSQKDVLDALAKAEAVWEKPFGKELFTYEPNNTDITALKINLVYDYREQATKKLADIGITVQDTKASYDSLKVKLAELKKQYDKEKKTFDASLADFNTKKAEYNTQVEYWNAKGGAPEDEYTKIQAMGADLQVQSKELTTMETHLNATIDEVNSLIVSINSIAKKLNLSVEKYNTVSVSRGDSFEEGLYKSDGTNREIDIYEFSSKEKLVRVLAHELGHALGLEHVDDPKAIMYKLNEGANAVINDTDLSALKAICKQQ